MAREHDADGIRMTFADFGEQFGAVHLRHHHIGHDDIHWCCSHEFQCLPAPISKMHVPIVSHVTQLALQPLQHPALVINKEKSFHGVPAVWRTDAGFVSSGGSDETATGPFSTS